MVCCYTSGYTEALDMAIALSDRPHGEWIETTSGTVVIVANIHDDGEYHIGMRLLPIVWG